MESRPRGYYVANLGGFGEWDLDIPYIEAEVTSDNGWTLNGGSASRCSDTTDPLNTRVPGPAGSIVAPLNIIGNGYQLHIPGAGSQQLLINDQKASQAYKSHSASPWVTKGNWIVSCTALANPSTQIQGEGFVAVSPQGVSYTLNWAVVRSPAPPVLVLSMPVGRGTANYYANRERVYLLVTEVQDRFGNTVDYKYNGNGQLTSISSRDGRSIALTWSGNNIVSATSARGTWQYKYGREVDGYAPLTQVIRPDGSAWTYTIDSGSLATSKNPLCNPCRGDPPPQPTHCQLTPYPDLGKFGYSVTAPSGATAKYSFEYDRHYRIGVPRACADGNPNHLYPEVYDFFDAFTIVTKQVTGPGLPSGVNWSYATGGTYDDTSGAAPGYIWASVPYNAGTLVYLPGGSCSDAASGYNVTVIGPVSTTKYAFGKTYGCDEGRLYGTETGPGDGQGNITEVMKTTATSHVTETQAPNEPFPTVVGEDPLGNFVNPTANRNRPVTSTAINQMVAGQVGAAFSTTVNSFDDFARATSETAESIMGSAHYSKTDTTTYADDLPRWVLGLVSATATDGITASQTSYYKTSTTVPDLPYQYFAFGKPEAVWTKTWNSDGTLASVADGDGNTTTFSTWTRGLPTKVTFADGTSELAAITTAGWITALTDENGFTTNYAYDLMGRLKEIDYPGTGWNKTTLSFSPNGTGQYGTPGGAWVQTIQTGNAVAHTYFDAFWRPLVTDTYDLANVAGTRSVAVKRYDAGGREIFASYPADNIPSYTSANTGTHTTYDALDRVTLVQQDWDLDAKVGLLPTTYTYLDGFKTQVKNPNGNITTTSYQAFGAPTTQWPVSIDAPGNEVTTIDRDVFGKPLSITRSSTAPDQPSRTRYYVYDGYQQLCKRIDGESGTTAFGYDGAGNLLWSAAGLDLPNTSSCDTSAAEDSGRVSTRTYDPRNRLLTINYADNSSNASFTYYPDGALKTQSESNGGNPVANSYAYDERGLLTQEIQSIVNTTPFTLTYGYDANGHLASTTYPDGRAVDYAPNALGQPTQAGAYATNASYFPNGAIAGFTYGNGIVHAMTQTTRGFVGHSTDSYGSTHFHDDYYDYDGDGNVAAISDNLPSQTGNLSMTYDALDRLTVAASPMFGGTVADPIKATYSYDGLDDLLSASVGDYRDVVYSYDADGQLAALVEPGTAYTLHEYSYDPQGNLSDKDGEPYQFDMANRLRNVPGVASYLYDAAGRRAQKNESLYGGVVLDSDYNKAGQLTYQWEPATQNATDYIYLGSTLVARVVGNNASTPPPDVPATPALISVTPATDDTGQFSVSWSASSGATNYVLWQNANNGGADSVYSGTSTSTSITGLASGRYVYQVQACNASGCSGFATSSQVSVIPAPPASITVPPYNFSAAIPVSWAASSLANNYVLEEYPYNGGWGVAYEGASTSHTLTVPAAGTYQFQVSACGQGGCSAFTGSGNVAVTLTPTLSASTTSSISGSYSLSWNAIASATGYQLYQSGVSNPIQTGSATSWSTSGASDGSYTYTVKSCNAGGCGGASNPVTVTVNHIAAPSLSASTTSSTNGTFSLSWNTIANATSYQLYQNTTLVYNSTGTTWNASGLADDSYAYTVRGCNGSTCGFSSNQVTVTVAQVAPHLSASTTNSTTGSYTLSWNTTAGATSYQLYQNGSRVYAAAGTSWSASNLASGNYAYAVHACNASGCSASSNAVGVTVLHVPPAPSLSASATTSSTGSVTLSWTPATGATSYQVNQSINGGAWTAAWDGTARSWSPSGLDDGTYAWRAYGRNASGWGTGSNTVTVTVLRPSSWVKNPPASATANVGFSIAWSAVGGATLYKVQQTEQGHRNQTTTIYSGSGTAMTVTLTGFPTDTFYFAVQACRGSQCAAWVKAPGDGTYLQPKGGLQAVPASGSSGP